MPSTPEPGDSGFESHFRSDGYVPIEGPKGPDGPPGPPGLPGPSTQTVLLPHPESPKILYREGAADEWWTIPVIGEPHANGTLEAPGGGYDRLQLRRVGRTLYFKGACRGARFPFSLFDLPQGFQPVTDFTSWEAIFPGFLPEASEPDDLCHLHVTLGAGTVHRVYGADGDLLILGWQSITFPCADRLTSIRRNLSPIQPVRGKDSPAPTDTPARGPMLALP